MTLRVRQNLRRPSVRRMRRPTGTARKPLLSAAVGILGLLLALPLVAEAQLATKVGFLWPGASPPPGSRMEWFRQGLRDSGYVEGQNVAIELRYAEGGDRLRELAVELVLLNVSVIATAGDLAPRM